MSSSSRSHPVAGPSPSNPKSTSASTSTSHVPGHYDSSSNHPPHPHTPDRTLSQEESTTIDRELGLSSYSHFTADATLESLGLGAPLEGREGRGHEERDLRPHSKASATEIADHQRLDLDPDGHQHEPSGSGCSLPKSCRSSEKTVIDTPRKGSIQDVVEGEEDRSPRLQEKGQENEIGEGVGEAGDGVIRGERGEEQEEDGEGDVEVRDGYLLTREDDKIWVDFSPSSPHDPFQFSPSKKWAITCMACIFTFLTSFNLASFASGEPGMELAIPGMSATSAAAGLSLFAWGFAIFPLILAPISEQYGRRPVFLIAGLLWFLFYLPIALGNSTPLILVFRFLQGGAGSVGATLSSGVIADIWKTSERGSKMSFYALAAVIGTGIAPTFMSWVEMNLGRNGWRWIQWIEVIITGVYLPFVWWLLVETRGALLLERAARRFRAEAGQVEEETDLNQTGAEEAGEKRRKDAPRYMARSEVDKPKLYEMMKISCTRPLFLLVTEPIVLFMSIWIAVGWGVLYGEIEAIPYIFETLYGFNHGDTGLVYISLILGTISAYLLNYYQEKLYRENVAKRGPEARLYLAMAGGIVFAIGAFIFAWTSFSYIHWIAPCIGITVMICGIFAIYLAIFNYVADSYTIYASSALAAQSFLRNMVAGTFPLWVIQCYRSLGINWASSLFGFLAVILAVVPFVAFWYGPEIRKRSLFSRRIIEDEERLVRLREEAMARRKGRDA